MSLLPKSHSDFGNKDFWEGFFKKRGEKAFEWYGEYGELCGILHKYIKIPDKVLNVGCGNSSLSADLYDVGYHTITNIDISDVAIRQMTEKNAQQRPEMKFLKMDVFKMEFSESEFSVVLDKGTLDAILTDEKEETLANVTQMFNEIGRVLRIGGRYICISLAQEHIVKKVLSHFIQQGWMVRICRVQEDEEKPKEFHMPVFAYVLTKFKKMPTMKPILEVAYFEDQVQRFDTMEQVENVIKEMQHYGVIRQQLNKHRSQVKDNISLDLYSAVSKTPRYTLHIVDRAKRSANKRFAIFIVPEGRETEWLFADVDGQHQLAESVGFDRLVVVLLHRDHIYGDLDAVKGELSDKVMELAPPGLGDNKQVPFLSVGNDINKRTIRHRAHSELSGDFVVEDVNSDNQVASVSKDHKLASAILHIPQGRLFMKIFPVCIHMYRRLIFLSNEKVVQSSARLKKEISRTKSGKKKGPSRLIIDMSYLSCAHHSVMVAGLALLADFNARMEAGGSVLIIGLGGGGLAVFLHKHLPKLRIEAVEIDPVIVAVAKEWFGFTPDENLKVHVADGLDFIRREAASGDCTKRDVIMLDVNSHDASVGMSCPPQAFIQKEFLQSIKSSLHPQGVLMVNVACRDKNLKVSVIADIKAVFPTVYSQCIPDDVNEVIFARPEVQVQPTDAKKDMVASSIKMLQGATQAQAKGTEVPNLGEMLNKLELL